jgi:D-galactarolactone cycloisomerase
MNSVRGYGRRGAAEIAEVRVVNLRYEYPDGGIRCAEGLANARLTSLVTVTLGNGLVGVGSAYSHPDLVRIIVEEHLAPLLLGDDPNEVERLWSFMYTLTRWYGRKGAAVSALGAVDIALWDLRGKLADRRVFELLGGHRGQVDAYASGLLWQEDIAMVATEAAQHRAAGFKNMKMRAGRDQTYDEAAVRAICAAIEPGGRLAVDGTHNYTPERAARFGALLARHNALWFEEPFPPEDIDAYVELRKRTDVPLAAGENEFGVQGFRELIRAGAIDIAQPDASRAGGITECRRIAQLAEDASVPIATHTWSDAVAVLANAHLVAAIPNGLMVEIDTTGNPFLEELPRQPIAITNGRLTLPDAPGLGIELDEDFVAAHRVPVGEHVRDGNYADLVFGKAFLESTMPERARANAPRAETGG